MPQKQPPSPVEVGRRLRGLRNDHGLSAAQVGERFGLSDEGWRHYERGKSQLQAEHVPILADLFRMPVSAIYERLGWSVPAEQQPPAIAESPRSPVLELLAAEPRLRHALALFPRQLDPRDVEMLADHLQYAAEQIRKMRQP